MSTPHPDPSTARLLNTLRAIFTRQLPDEAAPSQLPMLAAALAAGGIAMLHGDTAPALYAQSGVVFNQWAEAVLALYARLSEVLFPSFNQASAFYADSEWPPLIGIQGQALPVIAVIAAYVLPFAAARAGTETTPLELLGVVDLILDALEAHDLQPESYRSLRAAGADALRLILEQPVRVVALAPPAAELANIVRAPNVPGDQPVAPVPNSVVAEPVVPSVEVAPPVTSQAEPPHLPIEAAPNLPPLIMPSAPPRPRPPAAKSRPRPPVPTPPPDLPHADVPRRKEDQ